ncbi:MAG: hypothetical protein LW645_11020, partial [Verrucomicrobiaceae bacterium]|nr:hypothetical protein [Verrucomicrobiaceae bacterium]
MKSPLRASLFTLALTSYSALALANPAPATPAALAAAAPASALGVDFIRDVQPIFESKCLECHNPNKIKGKLLMD